VPDFRFHGGIGSSHEFNSSIVKSIYSGSSILAILILETFREWQLWPAVLAECQKLHIEMGSDNGNSEYGNFPLMAMVFLCPSANLLSIMETLVQNRQKM